MCRSLLNPTVKTVLKSVNFLMKLQTKISWFFCGPQCSEILLFTGQCHALYELMDSASGELFDRLCARPRNSFTVNSSLSSICVHLF